MHFLNKKQPYNFWICLRGVQGVLVCQMSRFLPLCRNAEVVLMWACPPLCPSVDILDFSNAGCFLHQLSPFLVCRLVITFCGSYNNFEKISFFGSKQQNWVWEICIFSTNQFLTVQGAFLHQYHHFWFVGLL